MSEYINCEIYISDYNRAVLKIGNWEYSGTPNLDSNDLINAHHNVARDPQLYGTLLFNALFPSDDDLLAGYRAAWALAKHQNKCLRFRLHIATNAPQELHSYEWERIYDRKLKIRLARSSEIVFSRYLGIDKNIPPPVVGSPKILVIVSSPSNISESGLAALNLNTISQLIIDGVSSIGAQVTIFNGAVTGANIRKQLVQGNFDTLHIHAHAVLSKDNQSIRLMLEKQNGQACYIDEEFLAEIFEGTDSIRLINLTACNSGIPLGDDPFGGLALTLVRLGCPAVIAMRNAIGIKSAELFTEHFYKNLALTGNVDSAANEARKQVWMEYKESRDWSIPTNFVRLADGKVWDIPNGAGPGPGIAPIRPSDLFWSSILQWIPMDKVVPIIGPNINHGQLFSNKEITDYWTKTHEYSRYNFPSNNRNDLPRVAGFVETISRSRKHPHVNLVQMIKENLLEREKIQERNSLSNLDLFGVIERISTRHFLADQDEPHYLLAQLPLSTYLTTNPDNFMFQALRYVSKAPRQQECLWQEVFGETKEYKQMRGTVENPLVFHLYGSARKPESIVLTEDDHLDFLRLISKEPWRLPLHIRSKLTESVLLFLGYNVRDLDFRILVKGVIEQLKKGVGLNRVIVLQIEPGEDLQQTLNDIQHLQNYLNDDCNNLEVIPCWLSLREFLVELLSRYKPKN